MGETEIRGLMCYACVSMSDSAEKSVYYPQFYDHKSHMTGEEYNDSYDDVDSGRYDPFVIGRDGLVLVQVQTNIEHLV